MKQKLYGNSVSPACAICAEGRRSADGEVVLCLCKGVVQPSYHCRKFRYDPLRRIPYQQPEPAAFTEEDFSLEN